MLTVAESGVGRDGRPVVGVHVERYVGHLVEQIGRHRERIRGVHLADWREPTRNTNDRVLPGHGAIEFGPILEALRWDGFYDLEIFSDNGAFGDSFPDSLWDVDAPELARRARESVERVAARA